MIHVQIHATADAAAIARRALEALEERLDASAYEDVRLLTTELVTNSVRHARLRSAEQIDVRATLSGDRIRVEVTDRGPGFDPKPGPMGDEESGWGLFLVDRIADRWGVLPRPTRAWFELRVPKRTPERSHAARAARGSSRS